MLIQHMEKRQDNIKLDLHKPAVFLNRPIFQRLKQLTLRTIYFRNSSHFVHAAFITTIARLENSKVPVFLTKKQVYDWIKAGEKTIDLRSGKQRKGDQIVFLSGKGQFVKGRILKKQEGTLLELLNMNTYKKIVPTAKNLAEALAFIKNIYHSTEGIFTAYEFQLNREQ